jgi:uncharacterized protein (DUF362 family)
MPPTSLAERRVFLRRLAQTLFMAAASGALGLAFWDPRGPDGGAKRNDAFVMPDFSGAGEGARMAIARGFDRIQGAESIIRALGGMATFIRPGDRVLLKVNAAFASPPLLGATTHPDMVIAVARMCFQAGAERVMVTDNPINDPSSCFELTGIGPAARSAGAEVILPSPDQFRQYGLKGGQLIQNWPLLAVPLTMADKLIGLAPVKDHHRSGASMTIKNWYGLLGGRRNLFHQRIHTIIAELAMMMRPTLVILDGTSSMMANGPTGGSLDDLRETRTLIAGTDPVAVDAAGAALLGKTPQDLPHLALAEKAGAGTADYQSLRPVEVSGPV